MKFKSVTIILDKLILIGAITEFIMMFFDLKAPRKIENIFIIFFIIASMSDFIETRKLRKLAYPLIISYLFIIIPIINNLIYNKVLYFGLVILSFIIVMIFVDTDLIITNEEKNHRINQNLKGNQRIK